MKKRNIFSRIGALISEYIEDMLILSGLLVLVYTTFTINWTAGMYCLGACMLGLGAWFSRNPPGEG